MAEEIKSVRLPQINVKCEDINNDDDMEIQENGVSSLLFTIIWGSV